MDGAKVCHAAEQQGQLAVGLTLTKVPLLSPQALHETFIQLVECLWDTQGLHECLHALATPEHPPSRQVE